MKNTLLALMLVSSLFVISCGADATKPQDAYKSQTTEIETGTKIAYNVTVTATSGTVNIENLVKTPGEKVTEIVQVTTTTTGTGTKTTNTVSAITKNADGGIYQFTISDTTAQSATVTYKYSKKAALPMIEKEATGAYDGTSLSLRIPLNIREFYFDPNILSVTDKNGKQLKNTDYYLDSSTGNTAVITGTTGYINGDTFTVRYAYRNMDTISGEPLKGNVTANSPAGPNATIQLNAATYAGRSYYLKANLTGKGSSTATTEILYANGVINSAGAITITGKYLTVEITSGTYELWVY